MSDNKIAKIRQKIDKADQDIVAALAVRAALIKEVAEFKDFDKIEDSEREENILKTVKNLAENNKLNPEFVKELYVQILNESNKQIKNILQK
jgi:chorismate mutase